MPRSIRVHWSPRIGRNSLNYDWDAIGANSVVLMTACEYKPDGPASDDRSAQRWSGDAPVRVVSIAPHGPPSDPNRGVTFMVEVDYGDPLPICTDITVLDDPPELVDFTRDAPH
jgi:hypothetical protein